MVSIPSAHILFLPTKGILAIDESEHTSQARFAARSLVSTPQSRRQWRHTITTTPHLSSYLSGIIVVEETLALVADLPNIAIILKVDEGLTDNNPHCQPVTNGLSSLSARLERIITTSPVLLTGTKWRVVLYPSRENTDTLSESTIASLSQLAQYAAIAQSHNLVPLIEPEIIIEHSDTLDRVTSYTQAVMIELAMQLRHAAVNPTQVVLKMGFVYTSKQAAHSAHSAADVGIQTAAAIADIASAVSGVVFLSGGLTSDQSSLFLAASHSQLKGTPHTYSFGRAIQDDAFVVWCDDTSATSTTQQALTNRLRQYQAAISTPQ